MPLRQILPTLVTATTLVCGLGALEAVRLGDWSLGLRLVLLAALADGIDGKLARQFRATSTIGAQFDSLADVIAFGAAPAFLFAAYHGDAPAPLRLGVPLVFALAGAYRLARFHAQPRDDAFCGLPITAGGALLAIAVAGPPDLGVAGAATAGFLLSVLMACRHPFPKLQQPHPWLLAALVAAALPVLVWPRVEVLAASVGLAMGGYVLWGLIIRIAVPSDNLPTIRFEEAHEAGEPGG